MRVRKENDQADAHLQMVEHLSAVVGHVEETKTDQYAAHNVVDQLNVET